MSGWVCRVKKVNGRLKREGEHVNSPQRTEGSMNDARRSLAGPGGKWRAEARKNLLLSRLLLNDLHDFVKRICEVCEPGAGNNHMITATMGFFGDPKEPPSVVLTVFDVKMLTLDLHLLRCNYVVH